MTTLGFEKNAVEVLRETLPCSSSKKPPSLPVTLQRSLKLRPESFWLPGSEEERKVLPMCRFGRVLSTANRGRNLKCWERNRVSRAGIRSSSKRQWELCISGTKPAQNPKPGLALFEHPSITARPGPSPK